ncbi:N-terminal acetyltransferase B complex auxiliary subunit NAA25 [Bienertia sinuspersici]
MFNSRIQDASSFVSKLETEASGDPKRSLSLAYLEIERRKLLHGFGDREKLIDALVQYFTRFGYLACFCSDVEVFLDILTPAEKINLLEKLKECLGTMSMVPAKSLGQAISLQKIQWQIGTIYKLPDAELESLAVMMVNLYCQNLPLSKDLDPQESMHGEELLCMVSNILVQLYWRTGNLGYLLETVVMLELGLNIKRFVSQYKILLLHLYSHLGALPVAYEWYRTLDVKNILLESVSHQILPQMLVSPLWEDLNDLLKDYLKFMDDYLRESADLTFLAYRHRNYSKVIEFVQFKERLQHSNQYLVARVESAILRLKEKANNIEEEEGVFECLKSGTQILELSSDTSCNSLTFNEDMQLRPWWTPTPKKNYLLGPFEELEHPWETLDYRKEWETHVREIVEKRSFLPRMIYLSVQCASASTKENMEANGSVTDSSLSLEMKSLLERYVKGLGCSLNDAVKVVLDVAEGRKSLEELGSDMIEWANFAVFYNAWTLSSHESMLLMGEETGCRTCFLALSSTPILYSFISSMWQEEKKSGGPADSSTFVLSQTIRDSVSSLYSIVEVVVQCLKEEVNKTDETVDLLLSSLEMGSNEGPGQVFRALKELVSTADEGELGDEIFQGIKSWSPKVITSKMLKGQHKMVSDFLQICEAKLKLHAYDADELIFRMSPAIKMYKLVGEERFLLWAVCSIQLQVSCGQGGDKLLALAEGLLKKHIASHSLHEPEALIVYISVLEQQGKYGDALEVLFGKLGSLILIEVDRLRLQGRLLAQSGDNAAAASTFQKILESWYAYGAICPDDWQCFLHYLGCLLEDDQSWCDGTTSEPRCPPKSVDKLPHITDAMFNSRIQDASSFVSKLETEASGDPKRSLSLAYLEIERRKLLHGFGDREKLIDALVQYFTRFGYLACFCSDVEVFLDILTPAEK